MVDQGRQKAKTQIDRQMLRVSWVSKRKSHTPGVAALQLTLQPVFSLAWLVVKNMSTRLLLLLILLGRVEPQVLFIKAVPSPLVIVR